MTELAGLTAQLALNIALLIAPALVLGCGGRLLSDPPCLLFLAGASALCLADLQRHAVAPTPESEPPPAAARQARVTGLTLLLVFWLAPLEHLARAAPPESALVVAGALAMLAGALVRGVAVRHLGPRFVSRLDPVPGAELARDGVYGVVRHPSELGLLLAVAGAATLLRSWLALGLLGAALLPLTLARVRAEERAWRRRQPRAYARYAASVACLVPFLR